MHGLMMDKPLLVSDILWRAERVYGEKTVVTRTPDGCHRLSYGELAGRVRRLASGLQDLGIGFGDRVGVIGWNTHRTMEASLAAPVIGAVFHGINLRMSPEQIRQTIEHAGDRVIVADPDQLELIVELLPSLPRVESVIVMDAAVAQRPRACGRPIESYEEVLARSRPPAILPELDERAACALYYTGGTTGEPKGVLFSHRGTVLMTLAMCLHGTIGVKESDVLLASAPIFHLNSWGLPWAAALQGSTLVLPGRRPSAADCLQLIEELGVTTATGAASVGVLLREHLERTERAYDLSTLKVLWLGGQTPPRELMEWWETRHGVDVVQGWGMTETTSMVTFTNIRSKLADATPGERYAARQKQGIPLPLCEIRIVDHEHRDLPWDGATAGELLVRSPWVASGYFDDERASHRDGWLCTGDVATVDPDGQMRLVDRTRDLVKSGGEWISSVDLESRLTEHPAVEEAAVVAVPDPTWLERPVAFITVSGPVDDEELRRHVEAVHPRFWVPDRFMVLDALPRTSVGKTDKQRLRATALAPGGGA